MIEKGVLTNYVYKQILKAISAVKNKSDLKAMIKCFEDNIPMIYFKDRKKYEEENLSTSKENIILSEYFIKED